MILLDRTVVSVDSIVSFVIVEHQYCPNVK